MTEFIFKGILEEDSLPEILMKIHYYKVPGVLSVTGPEGSKQVYISGGEVIFASSTLEEDRLGEFLLYKDRITQAQYNQSVALLKATRKRQGTILVEMGVLTPQDLYETVKEQVVSILWSLFNWLEGQVTFRVGKFKDDEIIKLNLDTRMVIVNGIKRIVDPKRVVKWMGRKEDVFEPSASSLASLPAMPLSLEDKRVFRLVDGNRTFLEVIQASNLEGGLTAKILYALYVLGLIQRKTAAIKITAAARPRD